ncbi:MAG: hypothetical protein ACRDD1_09430, partial [Planctomycetia bacterium]
MRDRRGPRWFNLFAPIVLLGVLVALLAYVLSLPTPRPKMSTWAAAWAVTDYSSPRVPPNDFGLDDAVMINDAFRRAGWSAVQDTTNLQTAGGFETFFQQKIPAVREDTAVVYLSAHGVSDEDGGWLLHADAAAPADGYRLAAVFERMWKCPARNKLLVLDAGRVGGDLSLGMLGNDFPAHVRAEFDRWTNSPPPKPAADATTDLAVAEDAGGFWVVVGSGEAQPAWTSPAWKRSAFALACAYGFRGGKAADQADPARGEGDGVVTARELAEFVQQRVSRWSLDFRGGVVQAPLVLQYGSGDFPLVLVDATVAPGDLLIDPAARTAEEEVARKQAEEEKNAKAATTLKTAENKSAVVATTEATKEAAAKEAAAKDAPKPTAPAAKPTTELIAELSARWRRFAELTDGPAGLEHPRTLAATARRLQRDETLLLAGQAGRMTPPDPDALLQAAQTAFPAVVEPTFHLPPAGPPPPVPVAPVPIAPAPGAVAVPGAATPPAAPVDPTAAARAVVQALLAQPGAKARQAAAELPADQRTVETELLAWAAEFHRSKDGEQWVEPDAVPLLLQARVLGELVAAPQPPFAWRFVQADVEKGDRLRRSAEVALRLGRVVESTARVQQALQAYRTAGAAAARVEADWNEIARTAPAVGDLVRWLGADPGERPRRREDVDHLNRFLDALAVVADGPSERRLQGAAEEARSLREQVRRSLEEATPGEASRRLRAALNVALLDGARRREYLGRL